MDYIAHDCPRIKINQFFIICLINAFHKHLNKLLNDKNILENNWLFYSTNKGFFINHQYPNTIWPWSGDNKPYFLINVRSRRPWKCNFGNKFWSDSILFMNDHDILFSKGLYLTNVRLFNVFHYIINVTVIDILATVFQSPWKFIIFFRYANTTTNKTCSVSFIDGCYNVIIRI